jgi:hypothetical protein
MLKTKRFCLVLALFSLVALLSTCSKPSGEGVPPPVPPAPLVTSLPTAPPAQPTGQIIDDFEQGNFQQRWWSHQAKDSQMNCTLAGEGYQSTHSLHITFQRGTSRPLYSICGTDLTAGKLNGTTSLRFDWRSDQPGLKMLLAVDMIDPTQDAPNVSPGLTAFEVELQSPGDAWSVATVRWDQFRKAPAIGEHGVNQLDPAKITNLYIGMGSNLQGQVWLDNLVVLK